MTICPIQTIKPDAQSVVIAGRVFKINRIPAESYQEKQKREENKAELRLAKRLLKKSEEEQLDEVRKKLTAERRQQLIKREGLKGQRINLTKDQRAEITPTDAEVSIELARLLAQNGVNRV